MSGIWLKICGITRPEDALAIARMGADAIGVILFAKSSRAVTVDQCDSLLAPLESLGSQENQENQEHLGILDSAAGTPKKVQRVALLVDPEPTLVRAAINTGVIDLLQFHGSETAAFCEQFEFPYMKAVRVQNYDQAMAAIDGHDSARFILLDSYQPNEPGGTGKTFDWDIAKKIVTDCAKQVILAGGLKPDNVVDAIHTVAPFGLDVCSGVEQSPGIKNLAYVKNFIEAAKGV